MRVVIPLRKSLDDQGTVCCKAQSQGKHFCAARARNADSRGPGALAAVCRITGAQRLKKRVDRAR
jgi:hypothetical protein